MAIWTLTDSNKAWIRQKDWDRIFDIARIKAAADLLVKGVDIAPSDATLEIYISQNGYQNLLGAKFVTKSSGADYHESISSSNGGPIGGSHTETEISEEVTTFGESTTESNLVETSMEGSVQVSGAKSETEVTETSTSARTTSSTTTSVTTTPRTTSSTSTTASTSSTSSTPSTTSATKSSTAKSSAASTSASTLASAKATASATAQMKTEAKAQSGEQKSSSKGGALAKTGAAVWGLIGFAAIAVAVGATLAWRAKKKPTQDNT
nr:hypothetical protein [Corynebacterium lactis]